MYDTEGKVFYKGKKFPVFYTTVNPFDNSPDRYRIILIETGTFIIKINDEKKQLSHLL